MWYGFVSNLHNEITLFFSFKWHLYYTGWLMIAIGPICHANSDLSGVKGKTAIFYWLNSATSLIYWPTRPLYWSRK